MDSTIVQTAGSWYSSQLAVVLAGALIGFAGIVVGHLLDSRSTRKAQLEMEWRKDKARHYAELIDAISDILDEKIDREEGHRNAFNRYLHAYHLVLVIGSEKVVKTMSQIYNHQEQLKIENLQDSNIRKEIGKLLVQLIIDIRDDLKIPVAPNTDLSVYRLKMSLRETKK